MSSATPRLAVFVSGNGGNLQALIDASAVGQLPAMVVLVVSDKADAFALQRAARAGIPTKVVLREKFPTRVLFDQELSKLIAEFHINWIILAGFMRVLGRPFVQRHQGKIINIHPSLLPNYSGMHAIERAYEAQEHTMGVTVHFVDEGVDTGPIIAQESFYRQPSWTLDETKDIVHGIEHRIYPLAIASVIQSKT